MNTVFRILLLSLALAVAPAYADPLDDAKAAGHVIESPDGYVKASKSAPASVNDLVKDINERRLQAYERIAKKNGISVEQVAAESYRIRHKKKD